MCTAVEPDLLFRESEAPICSVVKTRMIEMPTAIVTSIDLDEESVHSGLQYNGKPWKMMENV
jgi:hypothetical protein